MNIGELTATLGVDTKDLKRAEGEVRSFAATTEKELGGALDKTRSIALGLTAAIAGLGATTGVVKLIKQGFEFNKVMESSAISIASVIGSTLEIKDSQGKLLTGAENWAAAQQLSAESMERIKVLALETTATVPELVSGFQSMIGPAVQAGVELEKIPVVAQRVAQAMAAAQIPLQQMRTESRALLTGHITANDVLARNLGITKEMVEKWKASGDYAGKLLQALEAFKFAGEAAAKSLGGIVSNLQDAVMQTMGFATNPAYEQLKKTLNDLLAGIILIDKAAIEAGRAGMKLHDEWLPFQQLIGDIALGAANVFDYMVKTGTGALQSLGKAWSEVREESISTLQEMGGYLKEFISYVGEAATAVGKLALENAGLLKTLLEFYILQKIIFWMIAVGTAIKALAVSIALATSNLSLFSTATYVAGSAELGMAGATATLSASLQTLRLSALTATTAMAGLAAVWGMGAYGYMKDVAENTENYVEVPGAGLVYSATQAAANADKKKKLTRPPVDVFGGEVEMPPTFEQKLALQKKYTTGAKGGAAAAGKGGGGGGADTLEKLQKLTQAWEEEVVRLTGSGLRQLDTWYGKELKKIEEIEIAGAESESAKAKLKELYGHKKVKLEEDYNSWYVSATSDTLSAIDIEQKELLRKWGGDKEKEAQIAQVIELKKYQYWADLQEKQLSAAASFAQEMQGLSIYPKEQIEYQSQALAIQHEQNVLALNRSLIERKITADMYEQHMAYEALLNQMRQFQLERKKLETQGVIGGLQEWSIARAEEAAKRGYKEALDFMKDLESTISGAFSSAILSAIKGEEVNISDLFASIAESFLKKAIEGVVSSGFDAVAAAFQKSMGIGIQNPMVKAADESKLILDAAGLSVAEKMVNGANQVAAILGGVPGITGATGAGAGGVPSLGGGLVPALGKTGVGGTGFSVGPSMGGGLSPMLSGGIPAMGAGGEEQTAALNKMMEAAKGLTSSSVKLTGSATRLTGSATGLTGSSTDLVGSATSLDISAFSGSKAAAETSMSAELGTMSGIQMGLAAAGMGLAAIGVLTGSKELQTAGMVLTMAATALQVAISIMKVSSSIPFFQEGGKMSQDGLAFLHAGERVLTPDQTKAFDQLSGLGTASPWGYAGAFGHLSAGEGQMNSGSTVVKHVHVNVQGHLVDHDKFAREIIPRIHKAERDGVVS